MGDHLKKVKVGERLKVPAKTFNTFIDAARDFQERSQDRASKPRAGNGRGGVILVKNTSGADCDRFDVLGVDGVVFSPTTYPDSFKNQVVLEGDTPATADHTGKFVILAEPIADGEIGQAFISGVCPVKIDITDTDHAYADIDNGDTGNLNSGDTGAAQILWAESGTGEKWAVVRLGAPSQAGAEEVSFGKISAVPTLTSPLVTSVHPCDEDGSNEDTGTTISIYRRWKHGIVTADAAPLPQFAVGDVIAYVSLNATKGVLAGDWILPKGVAAADQYKVLQYDNTGKLTKDWLRFSD